MSSDLPRSILFFDGVCGLCNGFVDVVMRVDREQKFLFSPLQSEFAKKTFADHQKPLDPTRLETVYLLSSQGELSEKSTAVLNVFSLLGGPWRLLGGFRAFPLSFRNRIYDWVAQNRYGIFGKKDTCRLPTPEEKARFLL